MRLKEQGRLARGRYLMLRYVENGLGKRRFAVAVTRRMGNAVARNRIKRRLREIFRLERDVFPNNMDFLAIPLSAAKGSSYRKLREALLELAGEIKKKNI